MKWYGALRRTISYYGSSIRDHIRNKAVCLFVYAIFQYCQIGKTSSTAQALIIQNLFEKVYFSYARRTINNSLNGFCAFFEHENCGIYIQKPLKRLTLRTWYLSCQWPFQTNSQKATMAITKIMNITVCDRMKVWGTSHLHFNAIAYHHKL